jgi:LmbE family N-acetylglucosaminyl deacetylase
MKSLSNRLCRNVHRFLFVTLAISLLISALQAQPASSTQSPDDRVALYQALLDLQNPWTVMCVAAHPDDEDGTSLIVMRRKFGAHTVSLFSTFGEGGQNAIGPELYEELGAIRARETMAAAEIQGSEPHFLGLKDFGYSKTRDEAFKFWGHEEALRRMVMQIRKLRPDVIITNHSTTSNDHGQHQATALMVVEAFDAAADPTRFPEQLKDGVTTWQVQRLFVRMRGNPEQLRGGVPTSQAQTDKSQIVTIDPNEKDPVRGVVYAEEALRALQKHATQGPWPKTFAEYANRFRAFSGQTGGTPGQLPLIRYALVRDAKGAAPLSAKESHNFLDGMRLSPAVAQELRLPDFTSTAELLNNSERTREGLIETYRKGNWEAPGKADPQRKELMRQKMERAAALVAGLHINAELPKNPAINNSTLSLSIKVENTGSERIKVDNCGSASVASNTAGDRTNYTKVNHSRMVTERPLSPGSSFALTDKIQIPNTAKINLPLAEHLYEPTALGLNVDVRCEYEIDETKLGIDLPVRVDVAPPIELEAVSASPIVTIPAKDGQCGFHPVDFKLRVTNNQNDSFSEDIVLFPTIGPITGRGSATRKVELRAREKTDEVFKLDGCELSKSKGGVTFILSRIQTKMFPALSVPVVVANASVAANLRVAYIRGFDFSLPNALNALGVESKALSVDDVKTADLSKFTSVIVDNRVYESKPELIAVNQKLLDYANAGGTLIVFYHKSDEWNPNPQRNRPQLAPYKLILGNERITDENAPITFLEPDHPLLNLPNKLNQDDFKDWIQERGLYYPREWDQQFHALLQSNDPGEAPLKGGLLVADYGRGHYIYTSMVWYRELRGGIPGAYRMLANMISYGRQD